MNITTAMTPKTIIANADFSNTDAMKVLVDLGQREQKDGSRMWRTVCAVILMNQEKILQADDVASQMDIFGDLMADALPKEVEVPIAKKTGKPAFRSWPITKVRWQYANYCFNAIAEQGSIEEVFPSDKPLPSLADVRKLQKPKEGESAKDTIKRSLALVELKLDEITPKDHKEINMLIGALQVKWGEVMTASKS